MIVDKLGYVSRKRNKQNWFLVKVNHRKNLSGFISFNDLFLSKDYIGKRIRLKVEVIEDEVV